MKKAIIILFLLFMVVGCTQVTDLDKMEIINNNITTNIGMSNQYRTGYKYYLPRGLTVVNKDDFNEVARGDSYNYYIYIDVVSYYNKAKDSYNLDSKAYFSQLIENGDKFGYIEINKVKEKYLIEIMYNYAKIEVIVKEEDINIAISNAISILSSIQYNDEILKNLMGDNILKLREIEFNIFETKKNVESNYLTAVDDHGQYDEKEYDPDLIN